MAQETLEGTDSTYVSFENVWVKSEEPGSNEDDVLQPIILIESPVLAPQPPIPEPLLPIPWLPEPEENLVTELPSDLMRRKCDHCDYTTPYKHCMDRHVLVHDSKTPYSCCFCQYTTKTKAHLVRHVEMKHTEKVLGDIYACDQCDFKGLTKLHLSTHKRCHKPKLECPHCDYTSVSRLNLNRHKKNHKNLDFHQCDKCVFRTKYFQRLQRHLQRMHTEISKEENSCDLCGYTNGKMWKLKNHILRSKSSEQVSCDCGFGTFYKCELKKHVNNKLCEYTIAEFKEDACGTEPELEKPLEVQKTAEETKIAKYTCKQCSLVTATNSQLQRHMLEVHDSIKRKACSFCDYTTHDTYRLNKHLRASKSAVLKQCPQCDFSTLQKCEMRKHTRMHFASCSVDTQTKEDQSNKRNIDNPTQSDKSKCLEANQTVASVTNTTLPDAPKKVGLILPRYCNEIDYGNLETPKEPITENYLVKNRLDLKLIGVLNSFDKDKPFQCVLCEFKSQYKSSVQKHYLRRHTNDEARLFKCTKCSLATKTKDKLLTHTKRSQSDTTLSCTSCDFTTNFKCALNDHVKTHYTARCRFCNHAAKDKRKLKLHYDSVHSKKKLKCVFCDFQTAFRENLRNHENIHKGVKPFKCSLCNYAAVRMPLLTSHYKTKHQSGKITFNPPKRDEKDNKPVEQSEKMVNNVPETQNDAEALKKQEDKSADSCKWPTNYYADQKPTASDTYQAVQMNSASSISSEYWQNTTDHFQQYYTAGENSLNTSKYNDTSQDSMDIDEPFKYNMYKIEKGNINKTNYSDPDAHEPTGQLADNYIVTEEIDINSIKVHRSDDKTKPNKCGLCDFKSKHRVVVQTHYLRKHTSKDLCPVRCVHCDYACKLKDNMISHVKRSQSDKMLVCVKCPFTTYFQCSLTMHKKTHLTYRCRICKIHFIEKHELENHQAANHGNNKLKCHYCDFLTTTKANLIEHESGHKKLNKYKCKHCSYTATRNVWLTNHVRKKHPELLKKKKQKKKVDKDEPADDQSKSNSNEIESEDDRDEIQDFITDNYTVNEHLNVKIIGVLPSDDSEKPHKCLLCDYKSQFKYSVQKHYVRLHTDDDARPFKCINCGHAAKTKDKIATHLTRSRLKKKMSCDKCEFTTTFKCAFNMHEKLHFTFQCDICFHVCKHKYQLDMHYATYHSDKKFECHFCDYTTARKRSLRDHENIHKGIKPFKCDLCDYSAVKKVLLSNHIKRQHPNDDEQDSS